MALLCRILLLIVCLIFLALEETYGLLNFNSSSVNCGQTSFTSSSGTIAFTSSSLIKTARRCTYQVKTNRDTRIVLKWRRFTVDGEMPKCTGSAMSIYIGCGSTEKLIDFCSKNTDSLPHNIYTKDNCLKLVFDSTSSSREDFSASYYTSAEKDPISSSSYCSSKKKLYSKSGVIYSPRWPAGYSQLWKDCEWDIKVPSDYLIKLTFMDLDIYKTSYSCRYSSERLRLKGEKSLLTSYENKEYFCGEKDPFTRTTRYYELELEFKTKGYRRSNRGFVIGYIAYRSDASVSASKKITKIGYIGIAIAAVVLITCCAFFAWRRRRRGQANDGGYRQPTQQPASTVLMETKTTGYGDGTIAQQAPPPYSAAVAQPAPGYQGYPGQQMSGAPYPPTSTGAPYPTGAAPPYPQTSAAAYPAGGAPYPSGGAPYPAGEAPYPAGGAPYPAGGAPYPAGGAPYPAGGAPYPAGGAPYPSDVGAAKPAFTSEGKQASAPPY